jgi:molybdopterin-guanine dinucleotide biosynthesis protein A
VVEHVDAVVLAGGAGRRLGGVDKGALVVAGRSLLDRVLLACAAARTTVVVGPSRPTYRPVLWAREDPPGGGPLAGLAAGLSVLPVERDDGSRLAPSPIVLVLATDLPHLDAWAVGRLTAAVDDRPDADAAVFTDAGGRLQPLAGAYRRAPLQRAVHALEPVPGKAVRLLLDRLTVVDVPDQGVASDCDTPEQLAQAQAALDGRG